MFGRSFASVVLSCTSPPGGLPEPGGPIRKVLFDGDGTAVKVLTYDEDFAQGNWPGAPEGTQRASFALSLSGTQAQEGFSGPEEYEWLPLRPTNPNPPPVDFALVMSGHGHGATETGNAYAPGVYTALCRVKYTHIATQTAYWFDFRGDCAVIGGPINIWVGWGSLPTYEQDEDNPASPWYIQYFNYSHWNPPASLNNRLQRTQDAWVEVPLQPFGTTLDWVVPWPLDSFILSIDPGSSFFDVFAEGASEPVEVRCLFGMTFTGMYGDVDSNYDWDDTADTPNLSVEPNPDGSKVMMTSKITCHKPDDVESRTSNSFTPPFPTGGASCGIVDYMRLKDQLGQLMPGVWVQERFNPSDLPPGAQINDWQHNWVTLTVGFEGLPVGDFNTPDTIYYVWGPPSPFTVYDLRQQYWAATNYTI